VVEGLYGYMKSELTQMSRSLRRLSSAPQSVGVVSKASCVLSMATRVWGLEESSITLARGKRGCFGRNSKTLNNHHVKGYS